MRESCGSLHSHKTHSLPALPLAARGPAARAGGRGTPGGDRERKARFYVLHSRSCQGLRRCHLSKVAPGSEASIALWSGKSIPSRRSNPRCARCLDGSALGAVCVGCSSGKCRPIASRTQAAIAAFPRAFGCRPSARRSFHSSRRKAACTSAAGTPSSAATSSAAAAYCCVVSKLRFGSAAGSSPYVVEQCCAHATSSHGGGLRSSTRAEPSPHSRIAPMMETKLRRYSSSGTCCRLDCSGWSLRGGGLVASFAPRKTTTSAGVSSGRPPLGNRCGNRCNAQRVL
mmetsp:Transcript_42111/g.139598  ORF Transcript_42111/g.139598 Transcript_42111/m.139598 type:complete len:285 (+) Transcript_42111:100-954(+)